VLIILNPHRMSLLWDEVSDGGELTAAGAREGDADSVQMVCPAGREAGMGANEANEDSYRKR
jgi:hypothetical protein